MQSSNLTPSPDLPPRAAATDFRQPLSKEVRTVDLERIVQKLARQAQWDLRRARRAELAYRRFLQLRTVYPTAALVPTSEIDEVWHAHILDTEAYAADCQHLFQKFMHHSPAWDASDSKTLDRGFAETQALWRHHFAEELEDSARCNGKPCHSPKPCRCR